MSEEFDWEIIRKFARQQAYRISYDPLWADVILGIVDKFEFEVKRQIEKGAEQKFLEYLGELHEMILSKRTR